MDVPADRIANMKVWHGEELSLSSMSVKTNHPHANMNESAVDDGT